MSGSVAGHRRPQLVDGARLKECAGNRSPLSTDTSRSEIDRRLFGIETEKLSRLRTATNFQLLARRKMPPEFSKRRYNRSMTEPKYSAARIRASRRDKDALSDRRFPPVKQKATSPVSLQSGSKIRNARLVAYYQPNICIRHRRVIISLVLSCIELKFVTS